MIDKMITRNGQDVKIIKRTRTVNEYDDEVTEDTKIVWTKGIVSTPDEARQIEREGRMLTVDVTVTIPPDVEVVVAGEGTPDILEFAYGDRKRRYTALRRKITVHPYNKLSKQTIELKAIIGGADGWDD